MRAASGTCSTVHPFIPLDPVAFQQFLAKPWLILMTYDRPEYSLTGVFEVGWIRRTSCRRRSARWRKLTLARANADFAHSRQALRIEMDFRVP